MTHDDFIDEYLDQVEGDVELKPEPVRFNHFAHQKAKQVERPVVVVEEAEDSSMICKGCGVDTDEIDEYYMVQFDLWRIFVPNEFQRHILCVGCLEGYLGRQLISEDFIEAPVNYTTHDKSERLLNRMGDWFRIFDGPFATEEARSAAVTEVGKRIDGLVKREGSKYMVRVDVNTSDIIGDELTLARLLRVVDEVNVGDTVFAHDYSESADFFAEVVKIDGKQVYVRIDWNSANPWRG